MAPADRPCNVVITATANGPFEVTGEVRVESPSGETISQTGKVWLCRCGHSQNKPFCDGHHRRMNWREGEDDRSDPEAVAG